MRKRLLIIFLFLVSIIFYLFIYPIQAQADSYKILNMDIQATINENGSVSVIQTINYDFYGSYNGIYITIPFGYTNNLSSDNLDNSLYECSSVHIDSVNVLNNGSKTPFYYASSAINGDSGVYTQDTDYSDGTTTIKVYNPVSNSQVFFELAYTLNDICVKHNDIGEFYYNFIGRDWQTTIDNLNIDIYLPNNDSEILVWGHGPNNGISTIESNTHASFKVSNVRPNQYVAARIAFDLANIPLSTKTSGINAKDLILEDEKNIAGIGENSQNNENDLGNTVLVFAICLAIYWIILLFVYEKDKKYIVSDVNAKELFKKYNPLIAGCIEGNREILSRDIIAVILNLINKGNIKLTLKGSIEEKSFYKYIIEKVPEKEKDMDRIEAYIYNWVFKHDVESLDSRLKAMPKEKNANNMFKTLNDMAKRELNHIGANNASVPKRIRILDVFLLIISIVLVFNHLPSYMDVSTYLTMDSIIIFFVILFLPLIFTLIINIIIRFRHFITNRAQKISSQKVVTTSITVIVFTLIIMAITYFIFHSFDLLLDELLIGVATLIVLTDNLMLKNSIKMIEDYSKLTTLKNNLEYTLLSEKDIEQVVLWNQYLAYAVSFGIGKKIIDKMKDIYVDDDLLNLIVKSPDLFDIVATDYAFFYAYASLDRIFMRNVNRNLEHSIKNAHVSDSDFDSSGNYTGSGGFFTGGGGFHGGGGFKGGGGAF